MISAGMGFIAAGILFVMIYSKINTASEFLMLCGENYLQNKKME